MESEKKYFFKSIIDGKLDFLENKNLLWIWTFNEQYNFIFL